MPDLVSTPCTHVSAPTQENERPRLTLRWCSLVAVCCAAPNLFGQVSVLAELKQKVQDNLTELPNYVCSETIEQSRGCSVADCGAGEMNRFRLDVGFIEGKPVFGWPGSERLSDSDIGRLVPGLITDGDIVVLARLLLLSKPALMGERRDDRNGRETLRYEYRVPLDDSGWIFRRGVEQFRIGYQGRFWIDATTLDVVELQMSAEGIPPELHLKEIHRALWYTRSRIGSRDFLLPARAVLMTSDLNGDTMRTEVQFDRCRQYTAESILRFPAETELRSLNSPKTRSASLLLPQDFIVEVSLDTEIDSDTAAVGDPVAARLTREMGQRQRLHVGADYLLHGRISRMEFLGGIRHLDIFFTHLEVNGTRVDLRSRRNQLIVKSRSGWLPAPIGGGGRIQLRRGQVLLFRSTSLPAGG